ncbi:Bromodomain-containing protein [Boeremia exigua]|uniref:Bromodomain-containing protein n=1 Tax=Boeremia exigua TaxID=749465 RepID=UPI001E8DEB01|nr:Bromodomain-containing protein [Boeremia exigua]KAH6638230.1 Bromodomain-containing protein [Boeremia exigua]
MESASKRKAGNVALSPGEGRPAKRQKAPTASGETAESTTEMGLKFLDGLKQAKDKTGRPIAVHFMTLPDKDELPDYFEFTKLPLALDSIEEKLNNGEYTSLAQVESDCKRLVNNAKAYNDKKSIIYEDAERLRKTASNWMVKHNPAYRDGNYVAVATPVPGEENMPPGKPIPRIASTPRAAATPTPASTVATERPRRAAALAQPETPVPLKPRQSTSAAPESRSTGTRGASTPSFQHAQEQIIQEIIDHTDPGGDLAIFQPFLNLPTRALKDYYQLIKDPMSLAAIKKKVQGVVGRDAPTGHTLFKSWDAFESAMSLVWSNARIYNEDGSELYNLSLELEETFKEKLRAMRARVDEPPQPKLKLNMSGAAPSPAPKPNLKLKLRQSPVSGSNTPNARDSATPGVIVDNEALQRQQRHVNDSMGGRRSRPTDKAATPVASNPFSGTRVPSTIITPVLAAQARNAGSPVANGVKQDVQSPALSAIRPGSNAPDSQRMSVPAHTPLPAMAPPQVMSRPPSGSPHPNGLYSQQNGLSTPGFQQPTPYIPPSIPRTDVFRKVPLKKLNEALIPSLTLNTHPALNLPHPWTITIPASKTKTHHSATINLSPTHSYLQITPKVPIALTGRMYRLYVQVNSNKTFEVNRVPVTAGINGSSESTGFEGGKKKGEPVFEAKLVGGVNRIEVDIIAEKALRDGELASGKDNTVEIEKYTVFLHLARQGY